MAKKILLVDDRKNLLIALADSLEEEGYEVVKTMSGKECLDRLDKEKPDLAVIDVGMPGIDGYEVCRQIKQVRKLPIKVIIYTGTLEMIDAVKARHMGADEFIMKGDDPAILIKAIKKII